MFAVGFTQGNSVAKIRGEVKRVLLSTEGKLALVDSHCGGGRSSHPQPWGFRMGAPLAAQRSSRWPFVHGEIEAFR